VAAGADQRVPVGHRRPTIVVPIRMFASQAAIIIHERFQGVGYGHDLGRALHPVRSLLTRGGHDRVAQVTVWRQTFPITHQMDVGQGDRRRELLQEFP
jgi:hypothetical protein